MLIRKECQVSMTNMKYLRHILTVEGIKGDPEKTKAIETMKEPVNVRELRVFLGMVDCMASFLPRLSDRAAMLRELLKKDITWLWTKNDQEVFGNIKRSLACTPILAYCDLEKPVTLSTDASVAGVGTIVT